MGKCRKVTFNLHSEGVSSIFSSTMWWYYSPSLYSRSSGSWSSPMGWEDCIQPSPHPEEFAASKSPVCKSGLQLQGVWLLRAAAAFALWFEAVRMCSREAGLEGSWCSQCLRPTGLGAQPAGVRCGLLPLFPLFLPQLT